MLLSLPLPQSLKSVNMFFCFFVFLSDLNGKHLNNKVSLGL